MKKRFKNPRLQEIYERVMAIDPLPAQHGSRAQELFWLGYNGTPAPKPVPGSSGYAIWRAGKDRGEKDRKKNNDAEVKKYLAEASSQIRSIPMDEGRISPPLPVPRPSFKDSI